MCNFKWIVSTGALALMLCAGSSAIAGNDFQQWLQQQNTGVQKMKKDFQDYRDKRDREFTAFLKAQWKAVDIVKGKVRDEQPKPDVIPVAPPEQPVKQLPVQKVPVSKQPVSKQPVTKSPAQAVEVPAAVITVPQQEKLKMPVVAPVTVPPRGRMVFVDFFGKQVRFYYDPRLQQRLDHGIDKDAISNYWSALSQADYEDLLTQLVAQDKSLDLNDWAYATLVNRLATKINNNRKNESALLSWFLLTKSGYQARIAFSKTTIFLLVPSQQEMFDISYLTFNGKRYYAVDFNGKKQKPGKVYTYEGEYPDTTRVFDMQVSSRVASGNQQEQRRLDFMFEGKRYEVTVNYDRGRLAFFRSYPQLGLDMYFTSGVSEETATPLEQQLAAYMQGMSEQQAVNFLLRFVQTALKYETDDEQFGEENYLFPEETLFYPYSDCEDRAVLFAWLVRSLLKLEVIGLDYPGHVATAVHFKDQIAGASVDYRGKKYLVTDPTYINAKAGMVMPAYRQQTPRVISF